MNHPSKPYVMVTWGDAYGTADTEQREDEISHEPAVFQSYGWRLRSDPKGITLASEWSPKNNSYRGVMFIPRGMVIDETDLALSKKRQKKGVATATPVSSA